VPLACVKRRGKIADCRPWSVAEATTHLFHLRSSIPDLQSYAPRDEPGFLAAQVFALAAETGWPEERILHMPPARLAQYQHCLLRRNGTRTHWSRSGEGGIGLRKQLEALRAKWGREGEN
jgi:hypothetical protein